MTDVPMTFSVAAGVMIAAFFVITFLYGVQACQRGRWRLGLILIAFAAVYSIGIIANSV